MPPPALLAFAEPLPLRRLDGFADQVFQDAFHVLIDLKAISPLGPIAGVKDKIAVLASLAIG